MKQTLDSESDSFKKNESDIVRLNVTNCVLADNKERDSIFKEKKCIGGVNNFLENICIDNITDNRKLRSQKNRTYEDTVSGSKNIRGEPINDARKI